MLDVYFCNFSVLNLNLQTFCRACSTAIHVDDFCGNSLKMSKNWIVQIVLVANILFCSGLRSAAREKKAKCPTCTDIVDAFKKVNSFDLAYLICLIKLITSEK